MKLKLDKKIGVIALAVFFIFLMVGSMFVPGAMQPSNSNGNSVKLPDTNVVEYELTPDQENLAVQDGKTILKFYYTQSCIECINQKPFLEAVANQFSDQIILEEVINQNERPSTLLVFSYYSQKNLFNATSGQIIDTVCNIMLKPPASCAARKV
jgi:hypothetical protein